jgi:hypothetical protein
MISRVWGSGDSWKTERGATQQAVSPQGRCPSESGVIMLALCRHVAQSKPISPAALCVLAHPAPPLSRPPPGHRHWPRPITGPCVTPVGQSQSLKLCGCLAQRPRALHHKLGPCPAVPITRRRNREVGPAPKQGQEVNRRRIQLLTAVYSCSGADPSSLSDFAVSGAEQVTRLPTSLSC